MSYGATSLLRASLRSQLNAQSESRFLGSKLVVRITESSLLPSNIFQFGKFQLQSPQTYIIYSSVNLQYYTSLITSGLTSVPHTTR